MPQSTKPRKPYRGHRNTIESRESVLLRKQIAQLQQSHFYLQQQFAAMVGALMDSAKKADTPAGEQLELPLETPTAGNESAYAVDANGAPL
jgi:hypothetical protein